MNIPDTTTESTPPLFEWGSSAVVTATTVRFDKAVFRIADISGFQFQTRERFLPFSGDFRSPWRIWARWIFLLAAIYLIGHGFTLWALPMLGGCFVFCQLYSGRLVLHLRDQRTIELPWDQWLPDYSTKFADALNKAISTNPNERSA